MGLTIHYSLRSATRSTIHARQLVNGLRQHALGLPFQNVGSVCEFRGDECDFNRVSQDDPNRWLLIQASEFVQRADYSYPVTPSHVIAFDTQPGDGCEPANFGLCRFPATVEVQDRTVWPYRTRRIRTGLTGWRWCSFCKTQYASHPDCGGVENFVRCHLLVVKMLGLAGDAGIAVDVSDEGGFWQKRDIKALALEVGEWNELIAAGAGKLKDMMGAGLEGPILGFPDFEHLEAAGAADDQSAA